MRGSSVCNNNVTATCQLRHVKRGLTLIWSIIDVDVYNTWHVRMAHVVNPSWTAGFCKPIKLRAATPRGKPAVRDKEKPISHGFIFTPIAWTPSGGFKGGDGRPLLALDFFQYVAFSCIKRVYFIMCICDKRRRVWYIMLICVHQYIGRCIYNT